MKRSVSEAEFISTGYYGLQTGVLGISAVFTLVFAYMWALMMFLRKERLMARALVYLMFLGTFVFLHLFLYSASLFGQEWLDSRNALLSPEAVGSEWFYARNSVAIMRVVWGSIALSVLAFVTLETFWVGRGLSAVVTDKKAEL